MSDDTQWPDRLKSLEVQPITSFKFNLPAATKGAWLGFYPCFPWPGYRSVLFPAGDYEVSWDGEQVRWRYCGPQFSTKATSYSNTTLPNGNIQITPVGAVGFWEFTGEWQPGGKLLAVDPVYSAQQQALYTALDQLAQQGATPTLLAKLIRIRGF